MNMYQLIEQKITHAFNPSYFKLIDESHLHQGHSGHNGRGESHFSLTLCSEKFKDLNTLQQHKLVYQTLAEELKKIHALTLKTIKPRQLDDLLASQ